LIEQEWREPITMDTFKTYQYIANFYYNTPHQYMSFIEALKHMVEHNIWNITYTLSHLQVQVTAWPHCKSTLEHEWTCYYCISPCTKIETHNKDVCNTFISISFPPTKMTFLWIHVTQYPMSSLETMLINTPNLEYRMVVSPTT
jgi:hypothetical protein